MRQKVVVHEVKRHAVLVVLDFLAGCRHEDLMNRFNIGTVIALQSRFVVGFAARALGTKKVMTMSNFSVLMRGTERS